MVETLLRLAPYILPPLLGAIIGYLTNAIAIKMLFRPLTEKRFLGLRIPFTPGIIPRQRYQLSSSIANMVSTKLITPEVVQAKIDEPEFMTNLEKSVSKFTADLLSDTPGDGHESRTEAGDSLLDVAHALLQGFFGSTEFMGLVRRITDSVVTGALRMNLGRITPSGERIESMVRSALDYVTGDGPTTALVDVIHTWITERLDKDMPVRELVGDAAISRLRDLVPQAYDPLLDVVITFLKQKHTRHELSVHGRVLLKRILNRLTVFQRILVSATQYDRNLNENMPAIVNDVITSVERAGANPENRDAIIEEVDARLESLGETGIRTLADQLGLDLGAISEKAVHSLADLLKRQSTREGIVQAIVRFFDKRREQTLSDLIESALMMSEAETHTRLNAVVEDWLRSPGSADRLARGVTDLIEQFVGGYQRGSLSKLLPVTAEQKERIDRFLARQLREQIGRRVPELVAGLDVHGMVINKIDGLDMESVEQLLLMVIAKHLKWINLFGALLGSLIGGLQVVLNVLT
jgi:uncharacterized membrane protein YheB (UPF0754 family)